MEVPTTKKGLYGTVPPFQDPGIPIDMLMVNLVTEIQKHFPSLRRIRNASRLADPSGANDGDPIAL